MSGRIHIQHVLLSLQPGGLENGVVNVVNRLDDERFHSSVTCLQQSGAFADRIRRRDVQVHAMGLGPGNDVGLPVRLARLFRRTKTDVVHTRNAEAFFYGCLGARLAGVRAVVHSEHGRVLPDSPRRMAAQRWLLHATNAAFSVSRQLRADLITHLRVSEGRFEVIYNGVDVTRIAAADRDGARRALGAADGEIVIGSVGRLVSVKNYELLLRAFSRVSAPGRLVLIGDGPERAKLESLAAASGVADRTTFLGHREDVAELMVGLDVFVLPSRSEGMSNTLLEAMAAAVPTIASDVGGNREIVEDGRSGLLFRSEDDAGLLDRLSRLVGDRERRAELGRAGRERVTRDFSMDAMIGKYEALYERVARAG
ncbi:MAG TPA: glycosyltransferase [Polyangia bacterium]|nr:glycosyltransferase [Polyangia bacterium]